MYHCNSRLIGPVGRVFANASGDLGSIPSRVIPKTLKMVLDTSLLNAQQYKARIKGKVEQSREMSSAHPPHFDVVAIENGAFWSPSTKGRQLYLLYFTTAIIFYSAYLFAHSYMVSNIPN